MAREARGDSGWASRRLQEAPDRAPRTMERLAAFCLSADANDSRLGDLSEQYVRRHRRVSGRFGNDAWASALARLVADAGYVFAAANVALFARAAGVGLPLPQPVDADFADPGEGTMALARIEAAPRTWVQRALLLTAVAFLAGGAIDLWYAWRQTEALIVRVQREKAEAIAAQIERIVVAAQEKVAWATDRAAGTVEQRRFDALRVMRQVPELEEIVHLDADGRELLRVSRSARDTVGSGADYAGDIRYQEARKRRAYVGAVYFRNAAEPHVSLALARDGGKAGVALAELNLRAVADTIRAAKSGETGYAFLVDGTGRLVAGADANADRPRLDASQLPEHDNGAVRSGLSGAPVLSAQAAIPTAGWRVVVELPVVEAREPLWNALLRGAGVLGLGLAAVVLASVAARRDRRQPPGWPSGLGARS